MSLLRSRAGEAGLGGDREAGAGALECEIKYQQTRLKWQETHPYAYEVGIKRGLGGLFPAPEGGFPRNVL